MYDRNVQARGRSHYLLSDIIGVGENEINGTLTLTETNIAELEDLERVFSNVSLEGNPIPSLNLLNEVYGDLSSQYGILEDLGELEIVDGNCNISGFVGVDTGKLREVYGDLYLTDSYTIEDFPNLERVFGNVYIENTPLAQDPQLRQKALSGTIVDGEVIF